MKVTRIKKSKKTINFYKRAFKFREPFQIILDGDFLQEALKTKTRLAIQLPKLLQGVVTTCIANFLKKAGDEYFGAYIHAQKYEFIRFCKGEHESTESCILSIIGDQNQHRFMVATQSYSLLKKLKKIADGGVPTIHMHRSVLIFDEVNKVSKEKLKKTEALKTLPSKKEVKELQKIIPVEKVKRPLVIKKKKAKEPNPLSVKKKKALTKDSCSSNMAEDKLIPTEVIKKKRKRKHTKKPSSHAEEAIGSFISDINHHHHHHNSNSNNDT